MSDSYRRYNIVKPDREPDFKRILPKEDGEVLYNFWFLKADREGFTFIYNASTFKMREHNASEIKLSEGKIFFRHSTKESWSKVTYTEVIAFKDFMLAWISSIDEIILGE